MSVCDKDMRANYIRSVYLSWSEDELVTEGVASTSEVASVSVEE